MVSPMCSPRNRSRTIVKLDNGTEGMGKRKKRKPICNELDSD